MGPWRVYVCFLQNVVFIYLQSRAGNSTGEEEEERLYQLRLAAEAEIREAKKANEAKLKELGKEWKCIHQLEKIESPSIQ